VLSNVRHNRTQGRQGPLNAARALSLADFWQVARVICPGILWRQTFYNRATSMDLEAGTPIGVYEIVAKLGEGGPAVAERSLRSQLWRSPAEAQQRARR
jgi:hypothetical protein